MADYDVSLIPGGGVRAGGELPPWVCNRLDYVLAHHTGEPVLLLSAGTTHRPPPLDTRGFPIFESTAAARYLAERGIPPDLLYTETCSYDTIGNAFYARTIHTDVRGWRRLHIITSAFHLPRTAYIFRWVFALSPTLDYTLAFSPVPNTGMPVETLAAREERELASLERVRQIAREIADLPALHLWLHTQHAAYASGPEPVRADETVTGSY